MDTNDLERRIAELEIKTGFAEDLLDHLNAQVARHQEQVEFLLREILRLRQEAPMADGASRSLSDELPPHY